MGSDDLVAEFGSFQEVLDHFASRLSEEGIFIEVSANGAVGTDVGFQVRVRDGFPVLSGQGQIVQVQPDGVLLQLAYLDQPSLKLLPKLLEHYRRHGVPLLELPQIEPEPSAATAAIADDVAEPPVEVNEQELGNAGEVGDEETEEVADEVEDEAETVQEVPAPEAVQVESAMVAEGNTAELEPGEPESDDDSESAVEIRPLSLDDVESELRPSEVVSEESGEPDGAGLAAREGDRIGSALLIEASDFDAAADQPEVEEEIHLDKLIDTPSNVLTVSPEAGLFDDDSDSTSEPGADLAPEATYLDAGLSWLPDDADQKKGREVWVILLLIVLGVLLGVAVYFLVLRPGSEQGLLRWPVDPTPGQAVPAALTPPAPAPVIEVPLQSMATGGERLEPPILPSEAERSDGPEVPAGRWAEVPVATAVEPMTRLERITWSGKGAETVVTLWADGQFVEDRIDEFRVEGNAPREVVRLLGVRRPFAEARIELGTAHVRQLRTGLHQDPEGPSLHIVADLVDDTVRLLRTETSGDQLRVYFSKAG